jgi:PAS domain S-box-containing protein
VLDVDTRGVKTISGASLGLGLQGELLTELDVAAVAVDPAGTILSWNRAAARLYGRTAHEMLGTSIEVICVSPDGAEVAASIIGELVRVGHWHGELVIKDASGLALRLDVRAAVLMDGDHRRSGFEAVFLDVSGRVQAEQRAAERESRQRLVDRVAGLVSWEWDPGDDHLVTSDAVASLLGLEPRTKLTMADALAMMPSADHERVRSALDRVRRGASGSFSVEHRVEGSDGTVRWLEAHGAAVRDEDGVVTRVRGVTQDVTARVLADQQFQAAKQLWQATLDSLTAHIAVLDEHGVIVAVNAAWRGFAEREGGESDYVGSNYIAVADAADDPQAKMVARGLRELLTGERDALKLEYPCHSPSVHRWFLLSATRYAGSGPVRLVVLHADLTERHQAQEQAFMQAALLDEIDVAVVVTDPDLRVVSWNAGAERLYEWTEQEAIGRSATELERPGEATDPEPVLAALRRNGRWESEYMVRRKDGSSFPVYLRNRVMLDQDGEVTGLIGVSMDISVRKESERALLSARNYLRAVTDNMGEAMYTLDSEGHLTYANQVAKDLLGWTKEDVKGHVMHDLAHNRRVGGSPLAIEDCPIFRAGRNGEVVRIEDDIFICRDGSELPVSYTAAPFATEDGIEGCVVVFEDITERKAAALRVERDLEKLAWVDRIQTAMTEDRFVLYAQPIIDLGTGAIAQRELLLRMRSAEEPQLLIAPGAFLAVAEEYGLITEIDRWVIDRSAELAATGPAVQINVSARSISDPSLVDYITRALRRTAADPASMVFEITETTLISDETAARAFVERLHELGCQVALDDFGTGYGGFTYLKQLPVDYLKIDIEFVRDLRENAASRHVVLGIVNLAQGFGLRTVGEGVEDQQTLDLLRALGVDYAQGFYIGSPAPLKPADTTTRREVSNEPKTSGIACS